MPKEDTIANYEERGFSHVSPRDLGGAGNMGPTVKSLSEDLQAFRKKAIEAIETLEARVAELEKPATEPKA